MDEIETEFAVQMGKKDSVTKISKALEGIGKVDIKSDSGRVIIKSTVPWSDIQNRIESTGNKAVLCGFGGQSAVVMINNTQENIKGVVRFSAIKKNAPGCVVDGVIDGLKPGLHGMHVHECGDITKGSQSVGEHYNPRNSPHGGPNDQPDARHAGDLGNIRAENNGRSIFRFIDPILEISEVIGRSLVLTENEDDLGKGNLKNSTIDGNAGEKIAFGIIARSAGIFQNYKKICACDGISLWDERDNPLAGGNRNKINQKS